MHLTVVDQVKALLKTTALIAMEAAQLDKEAKQQQQVVGDGAGSGADVILPILVYAAVHSGMKHPYVHVYVCVYLSVCVCVCVYTCMCAFK